MLVLLDSKDLIDLVDRGKPVSVARASELFRERGWQFVLSTTNVVEYAASVLHTQDQLAVRFGLQQIESLPAVYIRHGWIDQHEVEAAYDAFTAQREPRKINPFVQRWDETLVASGRPAATSKYVNYRLDEMVLGLGDRLNLRRIAGIGEWAIISDRLGREQETISDEQRYARTQEWRMTTLQYGPKNETERRQFADWLAEKPMRCPGSWFHYRVREELIRNVGDKPKPGDLPDMTHVSSVPYVGAATFDRRMHAYARSAANKVGMFGDRLFASLGEILRGG